MPGTYERWLLSDGCRRTIGFGFVNRTIEPAIRALARRTSIIKVPKTRNPEVNRKTTPATRLWPASLPQFGLEAFETEKTSEQTPGPSFCDRRVLAGRKHPNKSSAEGYNIASPSCGFKANEASAIKGGPSGCVSPVGRSVPTTEPHIAHIQCRTFNTCPIGYLSTLSVRAV